jgi:hypothetical protein
MTITDIEKSHLDRPVWGAKAIGEVVSRSERQASYLLEKGLLPATKVGKLWTSTPRRLLGLVNGGVE